MSKLTSREAKAIIKQIKPNMLNTERRPRRLIKLSKVHMHYAKQNHRSKVLLIESMRLLCMQMVMVLYGNLCLERVSYPKTCKPTKYKP